MWLLRGPGRVRGARDLGASTTSPTVLGGASVAVTQPHCRSLGLGTWTQHTPWLPSQGCSRGPLDQSSLDQVRNVNLKPPGVVGLDRGRDGPRRPRAQLRGLWQWASGEGWGWCPGSSPMTTVVPQSQSSLPRTWPLPALSQAFVWTPSRQLVSCWLPSACPWRSCPDWSEFLLLCALCPAAPPSQSIRFPCVTRG